MTAPNCSDPANDIGPFYRVIGFVLLLGIMGAIGGLIATKQTLTWPVAVIIGAAILLDICLLRPAKFDGLVKTIADKLPGAYTKPPVTP